MNPFKRIARFLSRDFPKPDKTVMTLEEITQYWRSLNWKWQNQCQIFVYRIRKPTTPESRMMWHFPTGFDDFPTAELILQVLGVPGEIDDPYTVRIIREWETQPGISKKEEICIANFTLTME